MPTISGLKRRGYTPEALKNFVKSAGVAKRDNIIEMSLLEFCVREDLNKKCNRMMVVQEPVKITITNLEDNHKEILVVENNPEDPNAGSREMLFTKTILIERSDFMINPPKKFFRLSVGNEVRLKGAYIIKANEVLLDENQAVTEILCTYDPKSKSGSGSEESKRKVKGTLHWVSSEKNTKVTIREYDRLFADPSPGQLPTEKLQSVLNKDSMSVHTGYAELALSKSKPGDSFQFQRKGYYIADKDSSEELLVFNKTVSLRDNWKNKQK